MTVITMSYLLLYSSSHLMVLLHCFFCSSLIVLFFCPCCVVSRYIFAARCSVVLAAAICNGKEICNAFYELNDPIDQCQEFESQCLKPPYTMQCSDHINTVECNMMITAFLFRKSSSCFSLHTSCEIFFKSTGSIYTHTYCLLTKRSVCMKQYLGLFW